MRRVISSNADIVVTVTADKIQSISNKEISLFEIASYISLPNPGIPNTISTKNVPVRNAARLLANAGNEVVSAFGKTSLQSI